MLVDYERLSEQDRDELIERGKVHGLSGPQVFACDRLKMDPREYARFAGEGSTMTLAEYESARAELRAEEQAMAEVRAERLREKARGAAS